MPLFRLCGYLKQNDSSPCKIFAKLCYRRYNKLCEIFNVYLPIDTKLGRHCIFTHFFPVVINPESNIGENCIIHPCVLIGRDRGKTGSPQIGNNCFIGHGAKIIGNPIVGDWSFISPGAIITKNIPESSLVGAGVNNIMSNKGKDGPCVIISMLISNI